MTNIAPITRDKYNLSWRINTESEVEKTGTKIKNIHARVGPIFPRPA